MQVNPMNQDVNWVKAPDLFLQASWQWPFQLQWFEFSIGFFTNKNDVTWVF